MRVALFKIKKPLRGEPRVAFRMKPASFIEIDCTELSPYGKPFYGVRNGFFQFSPDAFALSL